MVGAGACSPQPQHQRDREWTDVGTGYQYRGQSASSRDRRLTTAESVSEYLLLHDRQAISVKLEVRFYKLSEDGPHRVDFTRVFDLSEHVKPAAGADSWPQTRYGPRDNTGSSAAEVINSYLGEDDVQLHLVREVADDGVLPGLKQGLRELMQVGSC